MLVNKCRGTFHLCYPRMACKYIPKAYQVYMLGAKHGSGQSVDCTAQSMDPCFAWTIHGSSLVR